MRKVSSNLVLLLIASIATVVLLSISPKDAYAVGYDIKDQASCMSLPSVPRWDPTTNTCTVDSSFTLNLGDSLKVENGTILEINIHISLTNDGTISNSGIIINDGSISDNGRSKIINSGEIDNNPTGTINNNGGNFTNAGTVINGRGTINNSGTLDNDFGGTINNGPSSTINNDDALTNDGTINNIGGTISNNELGRITNNFVIINNGITDNVGTSIGFIRNNIGGAITNYGTMMNNFDGTVDNQGDINNNAIRGQGHPLGTIYMLGQFSGNGVIGNAPLDSITISDPFTCQLLGGSMATNSCNLHETTLGGTVTIPSGITVVFTGTNQNRGIISNSGTVDNFGTFSNDHTFDNNGIINNGCTSIFNGRVTGNQPVTVCDTTFIQVSPVPAVKQGNNGPVLFANAGSPFTFTATVFDTLTSSNIPNSYVFWYVNGTFLTSCPLSPSSTQDFASCPISYTPQTLPQFFTLNATYGGDEDHMSSTHSYNLEMEQLDTIPPTTTAIPSGTAGANNWYISPVSITLSAVDNPGGTGVQSTTYSLDGGPQTTYSGSFTVTGDSNHTLTFNSTDNAGNAESPNTIYIPIDTTPPVITVPPDVTLEATGPQTVVTLGTANANDAVDGPVTVTNNATASYPVGITMIQYTATDLAGNTATAFQTVTITDTTPPTLTLPTQVTAQATGPSGAVVTYISSATDLVDGSVTPTCLPPSGNIFAFGTTLVTCTATDAHNNQATGTFDVIVQNKIPPTLSITSPANNAIVNTATVLVSGNASDIVSVSSISWKVDTGEVSTVSGITPEPNVNWSFTTNTMSLGTHTIQVNATDSAGLVTISTVTVTYAAPTGSILPPSGSGQITFNSNIGGFTSISSIQQSSLPTPPPPGSYPLGFFSWNITGFAPATSVTVTVTSPTTLHHQSHYFKLIGGIWMSIPVTVHGNTMTFTISDNGPFDGNPTVGVISDPAAIADPTDGRITGGGNIGKGTNFSFDVSSDLDKTNSIKGNLEYQDKYVKLNLNSNNVSFLSVDSTTSQATIVGTTDYDRHDKHGNHGTDYTFIVTISDPDKTGEHDTFSITATDSTGKVVYQNTGTVKGHIEIHKFVDHDDKSDSGIQLGNNGNQNGNDKSNNNSK